MPNSKKKKKKKNNNNNNNNANSKDPDQSAAKPHNLIKTQYTLHQYTRGVQKLCK